MCKNQRMPIFHACEPQHQLRQAVDLFCYQVNMPIAGNFSDNGSFLIDDSLKYLDLSHGPLHEIVYMDWRRNNINSIRFFPYQFGLEFDRNGLENYIDWDVNTVTYKVHTRQTSTSWQNVFKYIAKFMYINDFHFYLLFWYSMCQSPKMHVFCHWQPREDKFKIK